MTPLVISLGRRCGVAWQIRRRFNDSAAFPFDWLVTPLPAITQLVIDGFDHIADNLEAVDCGPVGWTIYNPEYRLYLHHDFPRDRSGLFTADWRSHTKNVADKYRFVGQRFLETIRKAPSATFVRQDGDFQMPGETPVYTPNAQYSDLIDALQSRMIASPRLILLNCAYTSADSRIITERVAAPTAEEIPDRTEIWRGSTIAYDAVFDRIF